MNELTNSDIPNDIARRITIAADQLYEESGRTSFPNVDTVRRRARVNMNDASAIMRVWRRVQTASATPLQAAIPDAVQSASQALLATVWTAATETANSNLQMAQTGWEQERIEAEACRQQLACAFDSQTEELTALQRYVEDIEKRLAASVADLRAAVAEAGELRNVAAAAEARAATAEARSEEITCRANDLKAELVRAHASADQQRKDLKDRLDSAERSITELREELRQKSSIESELREELARRDGQVDGMAAKRQVSPVHPDEKVPPSSKRGPVNKKPRLPNGAS
jgi:colicin import membrane protein